MKQILLILLVLSAQLHINAQGVDNNCQYVDFSDAPEELLRKRVKEDGMRYGNPYTMFVKYNGFDLQSTLKQIRDNIRKGQPFHSDSINNVYFQLYKDILINADGSEPNKCPEDGECPHPVWVKNNAIIYIVGLKYSIDITGRGRFDSMTPADRDVYKNRAINGLRNLNPNVVSCWGFNDGCSKIHEKAGQLVQYLQAYDLLKSDGGISPHDEDKNGGKCSPRNKLRQFARNLYVESDHIINSSTGWKKNHGIICASALGMAAIVLNDAGVETDYDDLIIYSVVGGILGSVIPDF